MYCIVNTLAYQYQSQIEIIKQTKIRIQIVPGTNGADKGALSSGTLGRLGWFVGGICSISFGGGVICT